MQPLFTFHQPTSSLTRKLVHTFFASRQLVVEEVLESISIWDSVEKVNELIGMHVNPINGSTSGVIVSSYFVNGHNTDENTRWIVAYYNGNEVQGNICQMKTYSATEIGNITLVTNN